MKRRMFTLELQVSIYPCLRISVNAFCKKIMYILTLWGYNVHLSLNLSQNVAVYILPSKQHISLDSSQYKTTNKIHVLYLYTLHHYCDFLL